MDDRTQSGHVDAHFAAAFHLVDYWFDPPAIQHRRFRCHRQDAHSGERGPIPFGKSTHEIHDRVEGEEEKGKAVAAPSLIAVLSQIILLDAVFSLDSVITAVGMVDEIAVMIIAVIVAVIVMMIFAAPISNFVERYPTIKMLALSFLLLVGVNLIAEGVGFHIPKGYTYFAMAFSVFVEMLNLKTRARKPN
jgi:predicted tellurium resistance membrane protein TerC